jgi:hypothetical protein
VKVSEYDLGWLLVCAVRYSFGRMTYAPSMTAEIVRRYWSGLSDEDRIVIRRDIDNELPLLGPTQDSEVWRELLAWARGTSAPASPREG